MQVTAVSTRPSSSISHPLMGRLAGAVVGHQPCFCAVQQQSRISEAGAPVGWRAVSLFLLIAFCEGTLRAMFPARDPLLLEADGDPQRLALALRESWERRLALCSASLAS